MRFLRCTHCKGQEVRQALFQQPTALGCPSLLRSRPTRSRPLRLQAPALHLVLPPVHKAAFHAAVAHCVAAAAAAQAGGDTAAGGGADAGRWRQGRM